MIIDLNTVKKRISLFIKSELKYANKNKVIIRLADEIQSNLLIAICQKAAIPVVGVAFDYGFELPASSNSDKWVCVPKDSVVFPDSFWGQELVEGIDAALLSVQAAQNNGLILGLLNREEYKFVRWYEKHAETADIYPLADLFLSEIKELYSTFNFDKRPFFKDKIDEIDLEYKEIEWADRESQSNGILDSDLEPKNYKNWFKYTIRQKEIISRIHQREKLTRHKTIVNKSICELRNIEGLLR